MTINGARAGGSNHNPSTGINEQTRNVRRAARQRGLLAVWSRKVKLGLENGDRRHFDGAY